MYDPLDAAEGLPLSERLLPQYLQTAGYTTGWVGKWHLGASPDHAPWQRGFAETFGFIGGGHQFLNWKPDGRQYTLPLVRNGQPEDLVPEHLTPALGKEAAEFIDRNAAKPWFLYVAFNAPHTPHQPTAEREAKFGHIADPARRKYLAQVSLLDDAIGQITDRLRSTGQDRRTLVFFFSDNGGPTKNAAVNTPLRGAKGSVFEGGIRVPFVIGFSDRLKAGTTYDQPVSSLDVMATALAAAGIKMPTDKVYDSVDLLPYLTGEKQGAPHQRLFWRAGQGKVAAVREGDWKLLKLEENRTELFNLADDIGEAKNLAAEQPTIVAKLDAALAQWDSECVPPAFPGSSVKPEDWGPGGANRKMPAARLGKPGMVGD